MRALIAGPLAGGSLPVARATAAAFAGLGYESKFIDYSPFADEFRMVRASGNDQYITAFIGVLERVLIDQINKVKPDILLGIAQSPLFNERLLDNLRELGVITLYWFVEDFRVLTYWKRIASHFDIFFSIQTGAFVKALAEAGANNHYYLPVAFDNNFDEFTVQSGARTPISFMGAPYPNRIRLFETLARYNLKIYGEGWDSYPIAGVTAGSRRISESEGRSLYRNAEINLNLHSSMDPYTIGGDFVNPRTFELAGMGCFQLSDRRELLPPLYDEDEVVQFADEAELIEKIEYYLDHEGERKEVARNARRRTLKHHLYEHRVVEIMNAVENLSR
ncbi:MAG: glycosyltransferase [Syntrophobacteraceae bacterium]|jgi:spore maturation protein CgeB